MRRMGTRVRITAQLVKADGVNVWAASYDRELTDVFAIQEGIAEAIAGALRIPLGLNRANGLPRSVPPIRRPMTCISAAGPPFVCEAGKRLSCSNRWSRAIRTSRPVGRCSPKRAGKWVFTSNAGAKNSKRAPLLEGAEMAARKAIALAPGYAGGYSALAAVTSQRGKWVEAMDLLKEGLARDPEDPELLRNRHQTLRALGYLKEALAVSERVYLLEPLIPLYNRSRAELLLANGQTDAGVNELVRLTRQGTRRSFHLSSPRLCATGAVRGSSRRADCRTLVSWAVRA